MALSGKLLNDGEHVVWHTRTHVKVLLVPVVLLIVILAVAGFLSRFPSGDHRGTWLLMIWVIALVAALIVSGGPFLRWLTATYTVTNRRLITRSGVLTRRGHDIPLNRISDVSSERGVLDRMLGCGTLVISDASTHGRVQLHDIPRVEQAQLRLSDLLFEQGSRGDDGT